MDPGADGYHVSQPIVFRQHQSVTPAVLWLQNAVPPLVAGASLYPVTLIFGTKYHNGFLVLSILVIALAVALLPTRNLSVQVLAGRLPLIISIISRWAVLLAILLALAYVTKISAEFSRRVIVTWALLTPMVLVGVTLALQAFARRLLAEPAHARRAIFVGCNDTSVCLASRLARHLELGMSVAGFFDDGCEQLDPASKLRVLGRFAQVVEYVKARGIDVIFVALPLQRDSRVRRLLDDLGDTTASIYYVPDVLTSDGIQARTSEILGVPVVAMCETPFYGYRGVVKRLMDVSIALTMLILAAPLMIAITIALRRTTRGSVIFTQRRYGLDGREFNVYKFRTMTVSEDGASFSQATRNDLRVTPLGRFLRRYSLDELPQLINVLQGRMSLVGPRPHAVAHNEECRKQIKRYMVRHKVLPGITGLAQVSGCRGETALLKDMEARVSLDLEYLRNWSPLLDLQILLLTAYEVFRSDKAY
jgi:putative colanic acid biosynthesis UDP-glucose lipid carrier transferase